MTDNQIRITTHESGIMIPEQIKLVGILLAQFVRDGVTYQCYQASGEIIIDTTGGY